MSTVKIEKRKHTKTFAFCDLLKDQPHIHRMSVIQIKKRDTKTSTFCAFILLIR